MKSRARLAGHAIHPMLVVFPLGLLSTAVVFDILFLITDRPGFAVAAAYAIAAGVIGGALAAGTGWIDWFAIPRGTRAKRIGLIHALSNGVVLLLFAISWLLRANAVGWEPTAAALVFGFVGVAVAAVAGWLGGELVQLLGLCIDDDADLDAPSSLSHEQPSAQPRRGPA
jgi:uncharacterized membrane protein